MATKKRLIDANELVDAIEDIDWYHVNKRGKLVDGANPANNTPIYKAFDIYNAINNAPTVDAVEVVRCKDCMWARSKDHREPTDTPRELICQCPKHHYIPAPWGARLAVNSDDFCAYGERKDNGQA